MIRNVLVPLDRSPFSEQALPPAIPIARRAQAQLHILHVRTLSPPLAFQSPCRPVESGRRSSAMVEIVRTSTTEAR